MLNKNFINMPDKKLSKEKSIILFEEAPVRRVWLEKEEKWYFSVVDVIRILTDSVDSQAYWRKLKERLKKEGNETVTNCHGLKMMAPDGKMRLTDVADTEQLFRLIQSIPSSKAEPFKRWLAKVGYERIQEIEDPELATERTRVLYKAKGYSDAWIEKRMRGIEIRETLTDEWQKRNVKKEREYAILTAEISKATFGMTPSEYQEFKGLKRENLRDHMNDLELIFTMLGEASTTEIAKNKNAIGFSENKLVAQKGGSVAGKARKDLEQKSGKKVSTKQNYLLEPENKRRLQYY